MDRFGCPRCGEPLKHRAGTVPGVERFVCAEPGCPGEIVQIDGKLADASELNASCFWPVVVGTPLPTPEDRQLALFALAALLLALSPAAHAGGLGSIAPMGPGTWLVLLYIAAFIGKVLAWTALILSPLALPRLMAWAEDLLLAWVWRRR